MRICVCIALGAAVVQLHAGPFEKAPLPPPATEPPPPVFKAPLQPVLSGERFVYEPKASDGSVAPLIRPDQVQTITDRFQKAYAKLNRPRLVFYVHRALPGASKEATPQPQPANPTFNLADRQTLREIEQIFGHPLRQAGATLVDLDAGTQLPGQDGTAGVSLRPKSEASQKTLDALAKVADVVVEVLINARNVTVPGAAGALIYTVPDIQAAAIRLSDTQMLGQAASADIIGKDLAPALVQTYGPRPITEATALVLMDNLAAAALK